MWKFLVTNDVTSHHLEAGKALWVHVWMGHIMNLHARRRSCSTENPMSINLPGPDGGTSSLSLTLLPPRACQDGLGPAMPCKGHTKPLLGVLSAVCSQGPAWDI